MECLDGLVGISRTTCPCIIDGLTQEQIEEMNKSQSGLYLDELPGALALKDISNIDGCKDYFELAKESLLIAKKTFSDDVQIAMANQYTDKPKFNGDLGNPSFAGFLGKSKPFQFMQVIPNRPGDATITLRNIKLTVSATDVVDFFILVGHSGDIPQVIYTTQVNTVANFGVTIPLPQNKVLPTTSNGRELHYYFVWKGDTGTAARDNKLSCGCSGGNGYDDFVYLKGGESDNLGMENTRNDEFSHGFTVNVTVGCETGRLVCREFDAKNAIAVATSVSIQNKANEILIEKVLKSQNINRITMMNREHLYGKRNTFRAKYEATVQWLVLGLDVTKSGCWICNQNQMQIVNALG